MASKHASLKIFFPNTGKKNTEEDPANTGSTGRPPMKQTSS